MKRTKSVTKNENHAPNPAATSNPKRTTRHRCKLSMAIRVIVVTMILIYVAMDGKYTSIDEWATLSDKNSGSSVSDSARTPLETPDANKKAVDPKTTINRAKATLESTKPPDVSNKAAVIVPETMIKHAKKAKQDQESFCRQMKSASGKLLWSNANETHTKLLQIPAKYAHDLSKEFVFLVYTDNDIVSDHILNAGGWEIHNLQHVTKHIVHYAIRNRLKLSNLTFVDIGANIGWFTLHMAALGLQVVSLEPMVANQQLLRKSLCFNEKMVANRVTLYDKGLSDKAETCLILSGGDNYGDGHLLCSKPGQDTNPKQPGVRGQIDVERVDDVISTSLYPNIVVLKMDVEGYEAFVIQGGPKLFFQSNIPYILMEFSTRLLLEKGSDPIQLLTTFLDAGYSVTLTATDLANPKLTRQQALDMAMDGVHTDIWFAKES